VGKTKQKIGHPALAEFIQDHDIECLELLQDITVVPDANANFTINFHFPADNEFFTESVLTKTYVQIFKIKSIDAEVPPLPLCHRRVSCVCVRVIVTSFGLGFLR
jgi:hypothetical protein